MYKNGMSIKELILENKGRYLVKLLDGTKWIVDLDEMMFDNLDWYSKLGTLEMEIEDLDRWFKGEWWNLKYYDIVNGKLKEKEIR